MLSPEVFHLLKWVWHFPNLLLFLFYILKFPKNLFVEMQFGGIGIFSRLCTLFRIFATQTAHTNHYRSLKEVQHPKYLLLLFEMHVIYFLFFFITGNILKVMLSSEDVSVHPKNPKKATVSLNGHTPNLIKPFNVYFKIYNKTFA